MLENEYEGLDEMFKSGLENSRISPPPGVWEGVAASVAGTGAGVGAGIGILSKVILGAAISAGLGVGAYFYVQSQNEQPQLPKNDKTSQVIAPVQQEEARDDQNIPKADRPQTTIFTAPQNPEYVVTDLAPELVDVYKEKGPGPMTEKGPIEYSPFEVLKERGPVDDVYVAPCSHNAIIYVSKLDEDRFLFSLNTSSKASNITWYVDGAPEYAGEVNSRSLDKTFYNAAGSTFAVKAKMRIGNCWDSVTQQVKIVVPEEPKAPSKFSMPYDFISVNGDGMNEELFVEIENQDFFELNIFDKNNRQMFRSEKPELRWTGKCGVNDCPVGTYMAIVKYRFKGESEFRYKRMAVVLSR